MPGPEPAQDGKKPWRPQTLVEWISVVVGIVTSLSVLLGILVVLGILGPHQSDAEKSPPNSGSPQSSPTAPTTTTRPSGGRSEHLTYETDDGNVAASASFTWRTGVLDVKVCDERGDSHGAVLRYKLDDGETYELLDGDGQGTCMSHSTNLDSLSKVELQVCRAEGLKVIDCGEWRIYNI